MIQRHDAVYMLGGAALIAGTAMGDRRVERYAVERRLQKSKLLRQTFNGAGFLGDPGSIVLSAGIYFGGIAFHSHSVAALGMYTGEAVVLGGLVAETFKGIAGRSRPKVDSTWVQNFQLGRGFSNDDYGSFPSAETTIAFAAATGSTLFVRRHWSSAARFATPLAYTAATLVAASRIYKNEHWASDVVTGALIGSAAGVEFDRWNCAHPENIFERIFLPRSLLASRGKIAAEWTFDIQ